MRSKFNKIAFNYFSGSWMIGILIMVFMIFKIQDDLLFTLIFLSAISLIVNIFSILLLLALCPVFPENKNEFRNSAVLLLFNFPILFFTSLIMSIF